MSKSSKNSKAKSNNNKADAYVCSDNELDLLDVTNECKVSKAAQNIDWETYQTKYSDILDLFLVISGIHCNIFSRMLAIKLERSASIRLFRQLNTRA